MFIMINAAISIKVRGKVFTSRTYSQTEQRKQVAKRKMDEKKKNCSRERYLKFTVGPQTQFHI